MYCHFLFFPTIENEFNACRKNYDEAKKELDACNCKMNASKSFVSKPSQTDKYDAVNEEIMTLRVKIDMLEKDKQQIKEQHEVKLKEKDEEVAKAVAVQATLNKTIDDHKQQFALCQINLEVTSKELELANAKIKATEDGTNKESMPFNVEESEEYKKTNTELYVIFALHIRCIVLNVLPKASDCVIQVCTFA